MPKEWTSEYQDLQGAVYVQYLDMDHYDEMYTGVTHFVCNMYTIWFLVKL